ncbi:MAG: thiamine phosphate synthase [Gammaproteobacteria bacterium]
MITEVNNKKLPKIYPITSSDFSLKNHYKDKAKVGSFFQYRKKEASKESIKSDLSFNESSSRVILNSAHWDFFSDKFLGLHLTADDLKDLTKRPISKKKILGSSCHDKDGIVRALAIDVDYIFVSPILENLKGENGSVIGWEGFKELTNGINIPAYALGGLSPEDLKVSVSCGGYGVAGIREFSLG